MSEESKIRNTWTPLKVTFYQTLLFFFFSNDHNMKFQWVKMSNSTWTLCFKESLVQEFFLPKRKRSSFCLKSNLLGWPCGLGVEHLPSLCDALGWILSPTKKLNLLLFVFTYIQCFLFLHTQTHSDPLLFTYPFTPTHTSKSYFWSTAYGNPPSVWRRRQWCWPFHSSCEYPVMIRQWNPLHSCKLSRWQPSLLNFNRLLYVL
jgi:hypothetical protein